MSTKAFVCQHEYECRLTTETYVETRAGSLTGVEPVNHGLADHTAAITVLTDPAVLLNCRVQRTCSWCLTRCSTAAPSTSTYEDFFEQPPDEQSNDRDSNAELERWKSEVSN